MTEDNELHRLIIQRATYLVAAGWVQHSFFGINDKGVDCFCPLGAVGEAASEAFPADNHRREQAIGSCREAMESVLREIDPEAPRHGTRVPHWNDRFGRTQDQVVALMARAQAYI